MKLTTLLNEIETGCISLLIEMAESFDLTTDIPRSEAVVIGNEEAGRIERGNRYNYAKLLVDAGFAKRESVARDEYTYPLRITSQGLEYLRTKQLN